MKIMNRSFLSMVAGVAFAWGVQADVAPLSSSAKVKFNELWGMQTGGLMAASFILFPQGLLSSFFRRLRRFQGKKPVEK